MRAVFVMFLVVAVWSCDTQSPEQPASDTDLGQQQVADPGQQQLNPNHTPSDECDEWEAQYGSGKEHRDCTSSGCYEVGLQCWGCYCWLCRDSKCISEYCDDGFGECWDPNVFPGPDAGPDVPLDVAASPDLLPDPGPGDEHE